jgi:hypothetical protein
MVTNVTQAAAMAANTASTLNTAYKVQTNSSNIIPPKIAMAIKPSVGKSDRHDVADGGAGIHASSNPGHL